MAPSTENSTQIGTRISSFIPFLRRSPENEVQDQHRSECERAQQRWSSPPSFAGDAQGRRLSVDQALQILTWRRPREQADQNSHHKTRAPREDGCPEILGHFTEI